MTKKLILTPAEEVIAKHLAYRKEVPTEMISHTLSQHNLGLGSIKTIRVLVCRLRAKLKAHDIHFNTVYGVGWHMPDKVAKKRLQNILACEKASA